MASGLLSTPQNSPMEPGPALLRDPEEWMPIYFTETSEPVSIFGSCAFMHRDSLKFVTCSGTQALCTWQTVSEDTTDTVDPISTYTWETSELSLANKSSARIVSIAAESMATDNKLLLWVACSQRSRDSNNMKHFLNVYGSEYSLLDSLGVITSTSHLVELNASPGPLVKIPAIAASIFLLACGEQCLAFEYNAINEPSIVALDLCPFFSDLPPAKGGIASLCCVPCAEGMLVGYGSYEGIATFGRFSLHDDPTLSKEGSTQSPWWECLQQVVVHLDVAPLTALCPLPSDPNIIVITSAIGQASIHDVRPTSPAAPLIIPLTSAESLLCALVVPVSTAGSDMILLGSFGCTIWGWERHRATGEVTLRWKKGMSAAVSSLHLCDLTGDGLEELVAVTHRGVHFFRLSIFPYMDTIRASICE